MDRQEFKNKLENAIKQYGEINDIDTTYISDKILKIADDSFENVLEGKQLDRVNNFLIKFMSVFSQMECTDIDYTIYSSLNLILFNVGLSLEVYKNNRDQIFPLMFECDGVHIDYCDFIWGLQFDFAINPDKPY